MKIQKENLIMEKNRDLLLKDVNLIDSLNEIFLETISSNKIKALIFHNKKSTQFNRASSVKESPDKDNKIEEGESKSLENSNKLNNKSALELVTIDKKPEIINCTCFDQANLNSINKFYTIYSEKEYIKDEMIQIFKKVKRKFI